MKFPVRFYPRFEILTAKPNTLGIVGAGELEVTDSALLLHHKKPRWFRFPKDHVLSFPLEGVVNVQCRGKEVSFQVRSGADTLRAWVDSADSAGRLAASLPAARTPEFAGQIEQAKAFEMRLEALGTGTFVTKALSALNIAVFAWVATQGAGVLVPDASVIARLGSNFGPLTMGGEWWRLATSMAIHFGLIHLLLNTWALWSGGHVIERLYGSAAFLAVYLFSGIGGSLASLAWNPLVNSAGASGAIFGLYGAAFAFFARGRMGIPKAIARGQAASSLTFIGYSLAYGFAHEGIDNAAHIGGLVTGVVMGALLAQPLDAEVRKGRGLAHLSRATAAGVVLVCALGWPVTHPSETVRQDHKFLLDLDWIAAQDRELRERGNKLIDGAKAGTVSDPDFAKELWTLIGHWWEVQRRVSADRVAPDSRLADHYAFIARYVQLHAEVLQMTHDAVVKNDSALMARAKAKSEERDALLAEREAGKAPRR